MGGKGSWKITDYDRLLIIYTIFLVVALLYPFRFQCPTRSEANHAEWLSEENGVEFALVSEIRSKVPNDKFNNELISGDGLSIEVWASTGDYQQKGPARIVSYSFDPYFRNFTLGQEGSDLIFRLRTEETDLNGFPETTLKNVFLSPAPYHIVVTYDFHIERIYVNGRKRAEETLIRGRLSNWDSSYPLVFGNENTGNRPWHGSLFVVAIYKRPLSPLEVLKNYKAGRFYRPVEDDVRQVKDRPIALYLFNESGGSVIHDMSGYGLDIDLFIPEKVMIDEQKHVLEVYAPHPYDILDILENCLGFAIFGFLLTGYFRRKYHGLLMTIFLGLAIGVIFSFGSESIDYFLDTRTSSLLDALSRVSGIAFGISINIYTKD
jgi:VanZ family protein